MVAFILIWEGKEYSVWKQGISSQNSLERGRFLGEIQKNIVKDFRRIETVWFKTRSEAKKWETDSQEVIMNEFPSSYKNSKDKKSRFHNFYAPSSTSNFPNGITETRIYNKEEINYARNFLRNYRGGYMKPERKLGAPAAVKAAIRYNDLLRFWKLDTKHELITNGTKVKWIYLKNNPYQIEEIAFLDYDMPEKIRIFLEQNADRKKAFESILLNKLEGFYSDMEWTLNLNPYIDQFFDL